MCAVPHETPRADDTKEKLGHDYDYGDAFRRLVVEPAVQLAAGELLPNATPASEAFCRVTVLGRLLFA
jgi:hypothetical protein